MHISCSALFQQHRIQHYAAVNDAFDFFNILTSPDLLDTLETITGMVRHTCRLIFAKGAETWLWRGVAHYLELMRTIRAVL